MRLPFALIACLTLLVALSCKKDKKEVDDCSNNLPTVREVIKKKATVRLTATAVAPVYLVEEGSIDTKLVPCNFPHEFYKDGLTVTISGLVKQTAPGTFGACCYENFVIIDISR
jgi:hypothetical protein